MSDHPHANSLLITQYIDANEQVLKTKDSVFTVAHYMINENIYHKRQESC